MKRKRLCCSGYRRRDFLHVGSATVLGLGFDQLLQRQSQAAVETRVRPKGSPSQATSMIMVWLSGGPATIDMWDMKPKAKAEIRGEFKPVATSADGIQICEHLPKLAKSMHRCTLVRSMQHTLAAHGPGTELLLTGNRPTPALKYPTLGSIVSHQKPARSGVPTFISMGDGVTADAGFLGAAYNPFQASVGSRRRGEAVSTPLALPSGVSMDDLSRRSQLLSELDRQLDTLDALPVAQQLSHFQAQAIDILRSDKTRTALDLSQESDEVLEQYGGRPLGQRLLAARRLVEAGVQFVTVGMSGWDTHGNNFGTLRTQLLPELDQALGTLLADLEQRGLLDSTVVYCTGEFGRTPGINGAAGRDHWARAMACLLAGGPFSGGAVLGATDASGFEPTEHACSPMDVSATVLNAIGIPPDTKLTTRSGRPIAAIGNGALIDLPVAS